MRTRFSAALLAAALTTLPLAGCTTAPRMAAPAASSESDEQAVREQVQKLLDRYESNDADGVVALLDPEKFVMLGSALGETVRSHGELRALMAADFKLWGTARFSDVRDFDLCSDGTLATAWCVMSFSAGGGQPIPVRLATTWRKVNGQWLLTQSANWVPTQG